VSALSIRLFRVNPALLIAAGLVLALGLPDAAVAGPINWGSFQSFFTDAQTAIMVIAAVLCVFTLVGGLVSLGMQGLGPVAIGLFTGCFVCVCVVAAPSIVHWAQGLVSG